MVGITVARMTSQTKMSRRGLLGLALTGAAGTALGPLTGPARAECAPALPGAVWDQSGTVDRQSPVFVDAFSEFNGASFQNQNFSVLSTHTGAAERYRRNAIVANERWLIVNQIANRDDFGPALPAPGTYQVGVGTTDEGGTLRTATASLQLFGKSCGQVGKDATSGSVTWAIADETMMEATYDLWFRADRLRGSFRAPRVVLCEPRPATRTCVKA